jgi:hypothetical protein
MKLAPAAVAVLMLGWSLVPAPPARAQHTHGMEPDTTHADHPHPAGKAKPARPPVHPSHGGHAMGGMEGMEGMEGMDMSEHASMAMHPLGFGHGRFGSGTSWLPDASVTRHLMTRAGGWSVMGHGVAFAGGAGMNGPRGDDKAFAPNMAMLMAERNAGPRTFWRIATMFSADALTVGGAGYPLLFQTGETWDGKALRDHQHPHNLVSELSASVTRAVSSSAAVSLYAAPVGEPALGPPAYPHRPLGTNDPLAPIGHHWQDATHIAYGVATAGVEGRAWRLEGSTFNGREPGENRAEIIGPRFDSFSGRLSINPARSLALQASHGYLHRPEATHPGQDAWRTTASAVWVRPLANGRSLDLSLVWGRNRVDREDLDSWLLEGEWDGDSGVVPFGRLEYVEKSAEELVLPPAFDAERVFPLRQATVGVIYGLPIHGPLAWGLGAQAVGGFAGRDLRTVYGKDPGGWSVFLRLRPRAASHPMAM